MKDDYPYFPFYVNDFLSSRNTRLMTPEQIGMYVLLLIDQWKEGSIPSDIETLAQICRVDVHKMAEQWIVIGKCFKPVKNDEKKLINLRLENERKKIKKLKKEKIEAAKKGAKARWGEGKKKNASGIADALPQQCQSDLDPEQNRSDQIRKEPSSSVSPLRAKDDEVFTSIDSMPACAEAGGEIMQLLIGHKNEALNAQQKGALSREVSMTLAQIESFKPDAPQKLLVNTFKATLKAALKHKARTCKWYLTTWLQNLEDSGIRVPVRAS